MKRMTVALVMLGIIVCTAFVTSALVQDAIDSNCTALNKCILKEENEKEDSLGIKEVISVWERNKKILYLVMFCEDFSVIEENMIELKILSENYDFSKSTQVCMETEFILRNKREEMKMSFENIF